MPYLSNRHILYLMKLYLLLPVLAALLFSGCKQTEKAVSSKSASPSPVPFSQIMIKEHEIPDSPEYEKYLEVSSNGPVIPGLYQGTIPQGLAYGKADDLIFISGYPFYRTSSTISVLSGKDGRFIKVLKLQNPAGAPHSGHVGGLAVSSKNLWIASGKGVYRTELGDIREAPNNGILKMKEFVRTAVKGSFASFSGNTLWIGEFTSKDGSYAAAETHKVKTVSGVNHGWMAGYDLDPETDRIDSKVTADGLTYPNRIISIPDEVQGAAFFENTVILSTSYGRRNKSRLTSYTVPDFTESFELSGESRIPMAVLTVKDKIRSLVVPPMSEGIAVYNDSIAVLYESGSDKYRSTALFPQGRIQLLDPAVFMK
ncbi:MAG: hypothetical protein DRP59_09560 [Spirochaetes bacterium]|nr:MAG: hypothetical protein DRP59_09560 [Spirochaetota bacterium]